MFCLAIQGLVIFFAASSFAEFRVSPGLYIREEYNDNINLDPDGEEEDDFITTIGPTLSILWQTKLVDLSLDYSILFRKYINNPERDETSFDQVQRAHMDATFHLYKEALFLYVSDTLARVPIDEEGKGGLDNELVNLTTQNTLIVNPYLTLRPWRTAGLRFDYTYTNVWNEKDEAIDYERHQYSLTVDKELTARISTYVTLSYSQYRPNEREEVFEDDFASGDFDTQSIRVGGSYFVGERLNLSGYVGQTWIDYKENDLDDEDTTEIWGLNADYQVNRIVSVGAGYSQSVSFSITEGPVENEHYNAYISLATRPTVTLSGFVGETRHLVEERTDDIWGLTLGGDWRLTEKYGLDYSTYFTHFTQDDPTEIDDEHDRYGARLGLYRDVRFGTLRFGYTYNKNVSDIGEDDYDNNIVWAEIRFVF